jgi:hypothetical protein
MVRHGFLDDLAFIAYQQYRLSQALEPRGSSVSRGSPVEPSIFLDFHLPNAATWLYFSLILSLSIFFQFTRPFSLRNLDLIMLFMPVPGFLLLQEAHNLLAAGKLGGGQGKLVLAYGWLLAGAAYWLVRAIVDLSLVRRPPLNPNLTTSGLTCLGLALFVGLTSVAVRRTGDAPQPLQVGRAPAPIEQVQDQAAAAVQQAQNGNLHAAAPEEVRFWVERTLAMVCHAAIVMGLVLMGWHHFQDQAVGVAMGTLYLLVPYTAFDVGRQLHHVWPTTFLIWAIYSYRRPIVAGWLLGLATGTALFPALLLPLWFGFYSRRGASRFGLAFIIAVLLSVGITSLVLWLDGRAGYGLTAVLSLPEWQPWQVPQTESIWTGAHWAYRMPIFVLFVSFVAVVTVWPSPKNLSHLIALSAAILIGIQFWHGDRGGVYVLWYLPLLLLMVFRPNLTLAEPPRPEPGTGLMARLASVAWRRVWPRPEPPKELAV